MNSKKLAQLCSEFADNKKAENLVVLDVRKVSSVTDYFVVASGTSEPHLRAIVS
jgi:ribosome-associated protein